MRSVVSAIALVLMFVPGLVAQNNVPELDYTIIAPDLNEPLNGEQPIFLALALFSDGDIDAENLRLMVNNNDLTTSADVSPYYVSHTWQLGMRPGNYTVQLVYADESIVSEFSFEVYGEEEVEEERSLAVTVDQYPEFQGGVREMMNYLGSEISFPPNIRQRDAQNGIVKLNYVVNPDGSITNPRVVESLSPAYDEEVLKVINVMPDWQPGFQGGRAVAFDYELVVEFMDESGRSVIIHQPRYLDE